LRVETAAGSIAADAAIVPDAAHRALDDAITSALVLGHLARVARFNLRKDNPTAWDLEVHTGPDFFERDDLARGRGLYQYVRDDGARPDRGCGGQARNQARQLSVRDGQQQKLGATGDVGHRSDVWYVPMGPLYAYHILSEKSHVREIGTARFAVSNDLDARIYNTSLTFEFSAPAGVRVMAGGKELSEFRGELTDRWNGQYVRREKDILLVTVVPNAIIEFQ